MAEPNKSILDEAKGETDSDKYVVDSALEGAGGLQDLVGGVNKMVEGDWTEGLFSMGSAGMGVVDLVKGGNPLETLMSWGFGWIIEHVDFLKEPLNWVTGDQDALDMEAQKWEVIGKRVQESSEALTAEVRKNCLDWKGGAADQYRVYVQKQLDGYAALSDAALGVSEVVNICKTILGVVRTLLRDIITDALAKIVMIVMRYPPPAYPVGLLAEGVPFAVKTGEILLEQCARLSRAFSHAMKYLKSMAETVLKSIHTVFEGFGKSVAKEGLLKGFEQLFTLPGQSPGQKLNDKDDTSIVPEDRTDTYGIHKTPRSGPVTANGPEPVFDQPGTQRISGSL